MKRVKMLVTESGRHQELPQYHCRLGHEYDVPDALAKAWIAKGVAVAVQKQQAPKPKKDKE